MFKNLEKVLNVGSKEPKKVTKNVLLIEVLIM